MTEFYLSHQNILAILTIVTFVLSLITITITIIFVMRLKRLRAAMDVLFAGKKGADLENIILTNNKKIVELDTEIQELFNISNTVHKQAHKGLHKIGLLRFNPFGERAGNQSFAIALLNSNDDGLVLSSLHTREGTRIYTKEIMQGQPVNNELTQEEQKVIATAK